MSKKKKTDRNIRGKVLTVFKENPSKTFNFKQIAAKLNITDTQSRNAVIKALGQLTSQNTIDQPDPGKYIIKTEKKDYVEGIIEITSTGNAYLLTSDQDSTLYLKPIPHFFFHKFLSLQGRLIFYLHCDKLYI